MRDAKIHMPQYPSIYNLPALNQIDVNLWWKNYHNEGLLKVLSAWKDKSTQSFWNGRWVALRAVCLIQGEELSIVESFGSLLGGQEEEKTFQRQKWKFGLLGWSFLILCDRSVLACNRKQLEWRIGIRWYSILVPMLSFSEYSVEDWELLKYPTYFNAIICSDMCLVK